jgi:probable HAF family extracellular repeat protein
MYSALDLSSLGVTDISPIGINNLGQVIGVSDAGNVTRRGFRTAPNSPINAATDYIDVNVGTFAIPVDINDSGQVTGYFPFRPEAFLFNAFRTAPNSPINVATDILSESNFTFGNAINNSGQVAVFQDLLQGGTRSFRTAPNSPVNEITDNIGNLGGVQSNGTPYTSVYDINDLGQVVGNSLNASGQTRAFRTAPNSPINPLTDDLGTLGGDFSSATAINNLGQVAGFSTTANEEIRAFITAPNSAINPLTDDLGTFGGLQTIPSDINDLGQVVGYSTTATGERRAFLYDNGQLFDLNSLISANLGIALEYASGINNRGQIIAASRLSASGESVPQRAFLLTPIVAAVPEPSFSLGLSAFAGLGGSLIGKRKKSSA